MVTVVHGLVRDGNQTHARSNPSTPTSKDNV